MADPVRAPFYHDGMRELQDRFDGRRVADGLEKHRLHFEFWEQDRKLIEETRFFFIATSYQDNVDCSIRSGDPGFVRITGPDTLEFPEYDGNNMYRTLGNIHRNPNVGLLFVRLDGKTFRTRIRGKATIHDSAEVLAGHHGAKVVVRVECEIFPNCPRYVPDLMGASADVPANLYVPRPGYEPPAPEWKAGIISRTCFRSTIRIGNVTHSGQPGTASGRASKPRSGQRRHVGNAADQSEHLHRVAQHAAPMQLA
ncbi:putative pyridoxine 5'-phosphate oxidase superfamily flavin-nucleotide-binding protein [Bradyrhizobium sp. USDA 4503]|uniref:pyridoxamine 5'-phosphate oxidase family protein n=2 Tax=Bradyrhizobium pachyrhizi TaxID=280333 RepID=UPI0009ECA143|nr:pyridoxamine 5'-phosphate oxidase family protein [Bradyrhizobium pachyrhizi]